MSAHTSIYIALLIFFFIIAILFIKLTIFHVLEEYHSFFKSIPYFMAEDNREELLKFKLKDRILDPILLFYIAISILSISSVTIMIIFIIL